MYGGRKIALNFLFSLLFCVGSAFGQAAPVVSHISPLLGPVGQWVYISGDNFADKSTTVTVGGVQASSICCYSAKQIGFKVPKGAQGKSKVTVSTPNGSTESDKEFEVGIPSGAPVIISFREKSGLPGYWLYVRGENFVNGQTKVSVGGVSISRPVIYNPQSLAFNIPKISPGLVQVTVETPNGKTTSSEQFEIKDATDTAVTGNDPKNNAKTNHPEFKLSEDDAGSLELAPQINWRKKIGQEMDSCGELYRGLKPSTESDSSVKVTKFPEIYKGVQFMMPLSEALKILGLDKGLIPSKSPISHAGVPFFFRPFDLKKLPRYDLPVEAEDVFNLIYVITDAADRVVGILLLCETPHTSAIPNTDFFTYNFVLNRARNVNYLKVRFELHVLNGSSLLVVNTWLIDVKRGKCLEISKWYFPDKVGNFVKHVLEIKLGIAPDYTPPK